MPKTAADHAFAGAAFADQRADLAGRDGSETERSRRASTCAGAKATSGIGRCRGRVAVIEHRVEARLQAVAELAEGRR